MQKLKFVIPGQVINWHYFIDHNISSRTLPPRTPAF
jgi:hypothetical protein